MLRQCSVCGSQMKAEDRFCGECGAPAKAPDTASVPPASRAGLQAPAAPPGPGMIHTVAKYFFAALVAALFADLSAGSFHRYLFFHGTVRPLQTYFLSGLVFLIVTGAVDWASGFATGCRRKLVNLENVFAAIGLWLLLWGLEALFVLAFAPPDASSDSFFTRTSPPTPLERSGILQTFNGWFVIVALAATMLGVTLWRVKRGIGQSRMDR